MIIYFYEFSNFSLIRIISSHFMANFITFGKYPIGFDSPASFDNLRHKRLYLACLIQRNQEFSNLRSLTFFIAPRNSKPEYLI